MQTLLPELAGQAGALRDLIAFYRTSEGESALGVLPRGRGVLLTGMGASYHAAAIAALHLNSLGLPAAAIEATDLMHYGRGAVAAGQMLVYVSQSGRSGEIVPALDALRDQVRLVAVTNDVSSPLAQAGQMVLPVKAGAEALVASKSYTNTLAALWLAARQWADARGAGDFDVLSDVADRMAALFDRRGTITERMLAEYGECKHLVFLGHGPHGFTARQAAMVMSEWAKLPAHHFGVGAFRHGFIETVTPETGAIVFAPSGPSQASALRLARELSDYSAQVTVIQNGVLRGIAEAAAGESLNPEGLDDEFLSPLVDIVPILLFADALAAQRLAEPGFRHIGKVVTNV